MRCGCSAIILGIRELIWIDGLCVAAADSAVGRTKAKWNRAVCNVHRAAILNSTRTPIPLCCGFRKIQPLQLVIISFSLANEWHRMNGAFFGRSFNFRFFRFCSVVRYCVGFKVYRILWISDRIRADRSFGQFVKWLFRTWRRDGGPGNWCRRCRKSVLHHTSVLNVISIEWNIENHVALSWITIEPRK